MLESERFSIPELAFERAIQTGRLSDDEHAEDYNAVGHGLTPRAGSHLCGR